MIVAVSGIDGSGKTTVTQKIKELYVAKGYEAIIIPEFDYFFTKQIRNILGSLKVSSPVRNHLLYSKPKITPLRALWILLVFTDLQLKTLACKVSRKKVYIFDRYFADFGASFYSLTKAQWVMKLYKFFPPPNISIYCWDEPERLLKRRSYQTHKIDYYIQQLTLYKLIIHTHFTLRTDEISDQKIEDIITNHEKR